MAHDSRSVLTRPGPAPDITVAYGPGRDQVADVWVGGATLIVFLHGGFWRPEFDRTHTRPLAGALVRAGFSVATPEYRRAGWSAVAADVAAAVAALPGMIAALIAPRTVEAGVILSGHSAGGHLALWAASRCAAARAVVALAPVADLIMADELDLDGGAVRALLGGGPGEVPGRYAAAAVPAAVGVPVTILHGDRDRQVPVELSRALAARAAAAGHPIRLEELPDTDHFAVIDPESAAWPAVVAALSCGSRV